jgi:hypothetical protein
MAATININGTLVNHQSSGVQDNDIAIQSTLTGLSAAFITFLNDVTAVGASALSPAQKNFAGDVEAVISGSNYVSVTPNGFSVSDLFFSDAAGSALDGDQAIFNGNPLQTVGGQNIYLWSFGNFVLATTSNVAATKGDVVAAFYLNEATNHLSASIEEVTFIPIAHPDATNPDDRINWTNILNVSAMHYHSGY